MSMRRMCELLITATIAGVISSWCLIGDVSAQNVTCATRPVGDNTNACASTAFVNNEMATYTPPLMQYHFFIGDGSNSAADTALSGDCIYGGSGIICTKTNGVSFAASATTNTTDASNISTGSLSLSRIATIANNTILGNISGGVAAPAAITTTQLTSLCNPFTTSLSGCVAASGGGTYNRLRADGNWVPANQGTITLVDAMDAYYGVGSWTRRTGVGTGSDIQPAITAALQALRSVYGRGAVIISPGTWLMNSGINPADLSGNYIIGYGSQSSKIVYNKNSGAAFKWSGASGYTGGGMHGIGLFLESGYAGSSSYAIILSGDATYQPDQMMFSDLYVTILGSSTWYAALTADGSARTSPQGLRVLSMDNIQLFGSSSYAAYFKNVLQCSIRNIGTYSGAGTGMDFYITGGGTSSTNSTQCSFDTMYVGGTLYLNNSSNIYLNGVGASAIFDTTATKVWGSYYYTGSLTGSLGANSFVNTGSGFGGGGGGTPGGSNTQVQFNNSGTFGGSANLTWVSPALTVGAAGSTTGQIKLTGATSGTITTQGQAVAGTYNWNYPTTAGTSGSLLTSGGGTTNPMTWTTPGDLTKVDDTNVTLTLGGTPTGALVKAASITAGWTGQLALSRGGTNANLIASNGGLVYSGASGLAILSGTATANQIPLSGSSAAPSWSTTTYPATTSAGTVLGSSSANVIAATATPTLGANGGTGGQITLNGSTSGSAVIKVPAAAGTGTIFQLPSSNGSSGQFLKTNGAGILSWDSPSGAGTVTSVTCNGGATVITSSGTCASREVLTADRTYYVRTDGNDTACTGLTNAAYVSGSYPQNCGFLTIQKGVDTVAALDVVTYTATIQVGNGTYTSGITLKSPLGSGTLNLLGDTTTPSNVNISTTSANAISSVAQPARWNVGGFKITTTTSGSGISAIQNSAITVSGKMEFGAVAAYHLYAAQNGTVSFVADYTISGGAAVHWAVSDGGLVQCNVRTITLSGTPAFSTAFALASRSGIIQSISNTFSGSATGPRYNVQSTAIIDVNGAGTTALPGNAAGTGTNPGASPYGLYQ